MTNWYVRSGERAGAVIAALAVVVCCCVWSTAAAAQRFLGGVVDYASILSPADINRLQAAAGMLAPRIGTDLFVITVNDREPLWSALGTHRSMVEKAFRDLETARARHYGANQKLTVLVVFKSSVVLHLYTNRQAIEQTLLLNNFYGGLRTTELKIRRQNESHADAAMRYLGAFNASATSGLPSQMSDVVLNRFSQFALLLSRELWETFDAIPGFGPAYTHGLLHASTIFTSNVFLPGYMSFLLFCVALHLLIKGCLGLFKSILSSWRPASTSASVAVEVGSEIWEPFVEALLLAPVLALLFSIANYDVENMLYLHQAFGTDLARHLDWARAIWAVSPEVGWWLIGIAALVVVVLESLKLYFTPHRKLLHWLPFVWKLAVKLILVISTGVFTGLVAGYFIFSIIAFQLWDIFKLNGEASGGEAGALQEAGVKQR